MIDRARIGAALASALFAAGCGAALSGGTSGVEPLHSTVEIASLTTGVRGPRLVPESIELERSFGVEPGGGLRGIAAGVRVVSFASGAVLTAPDRLTQAPSTIQVLDDRLGGGVLFAIGDTLWRAEKWLAPATAVFKAPAPIRNVWIGLDRVVLKMPNGALIAVDPASGAPLDLGALPASPAILAYAALDGFRAVALADLRGVVATTDAGATWRTVPIPAEPRELVTTGDTLTVLGTMGREGVAFEVRPEGDFARTRTPPTSAEAKSSAAKSSRANDASPLVPIGGDKALGPRPLALAVVDGIPLADGSALVAHAGALGRVRLADGAILDLARDAFPLRSAHCHGIALEAGAGFVCGEPAGATHVYRYVPARRALELAMAFKEPRAVLAAGNGALAVRGRCADDAKTPTPVPGVRDTEVTYCVRDASGEMREQVLTAAVDNARVVALKDGRLAVIVPPRGDVVGGQITIVAAGTPPKTYPIVFEEPADAARPVLAQGMWLDGFEERAPGVFGGWVEHAGTLLGVEIRDGGRARHGTFVRDAGTGFVAGRFGLAWTGAQRGFESTDGGMTWRGIDLPDKLDKSAAFGSVRGCSAIGCSLAGWLRVGWGDTPAATTMPQHSLAMARPSVAPALDLACDMISHAVAAPRRTGLATAPGARISLQYSSGMWRASGGEFTPFYGALPPARPNDDAEAQYDVQELSDHQRNLGALARIYVWGQKGLEWDASSRWVVRWTSPYEASSEIHSSPAAPPPKAVIEAARFAAGGPVRALTNVSVAASDDPKHALLIAARGGASMLSGVETLIAILDDGRAPVEVRRADNEPFGRVDAALRVEGRWFVATEPGPNEPAAAVLWEIEAGVARELARVPRVEGSRLDGGRPPGPVRLARREGESTIGIVVEGQPSADGRPARRWVLGIDVTSGRVGELEMLGGADYDGRTLAPCTGDEGGWVVEMPFVNQPLRITLPGHAAIALRSAYGRVRFARGKACIDRFTAAYDGNVEDLPHSTPRTNAERAVTVGLVTSGTRQELKCRAP